MSTYVMADIHGCYFEMQEMLKQINFLSQDLLVIAGDYIDRGEHSLEMLKWIESCPKNVIFLRGNHDEEFVQCISLMDSIFKNKNLPANSMENTKAVYQYLKELAFAKGAIPFDYYSTIEKLIDENTIDMNQLLVWKQCIDKMSYVYETVIDDRKCIIVHAGYIKKLDGIETEDYFDSLQEFFLYARDDAYMFGGIEHGMVIAGHTPTIFEQELPFNEGQVYRSYDEILDCVFYDIDCGCAYRKKYANAKLACIRIEDEKVFYI